MKEPLPRRRREPAEERRAEHESRDDLANDARLADPPHEGGEGEAPGVTALPVPRRILRCAAAVGAGQLLQCIDRDQIVSLGLAPLLPAGRRIDDTNLGAQPLALHHVVVRVEIWPGREPMLPGERVDRRVELRHAVVLGGSKRNARENRNPSRPLHQLHHRFEVLLT